jgi:hypothetical protein
LGWLLGRATGRLSSRSMGWLVAERTEGSTAGLGTGSSGVMVNDPINGLVAEPTNGSTAALGTALANGSTAGLDAGPTAGSADGLAAGLDAGPTNELANEPTDELASELANGPANELMDELASCAMSPFRRAARLEAQGSRWGSRGWAGGAADLVERGWARGYRWGGCLGGRR